MISLPNTATVLRTLIAHHHRFGLFSAYYKCPRFSNRRPPFLKILRNSDLNSTNRHNARDDDLADDDDGNYTRIARVSLIISLLARGVCFGQICAPQSSIIEDGGGWWFGGLEGGDCEIARDAIANSDERDGRDL